MCYVWVSCRHDYTKKKKNLKSKSFFNTILGDNHKNYSPNPGDGVSENIRNIIQGGVSVGVFKQYRAQWQNLKFFKGGNNTLNVDKWIANKLYLIHKLRKIFNKFYWNYILLKIIVTCVILYLNEVLSLPMYLQFLRM